ncbi:hypothetical protein [Rhodococcus rhodochrous]|uniref:hypothetical protein n=1 Tax=Rhodococcus rhodochrous TaxID=1829 RepID=UPI001E335C1C|nr:hypothetical protein [Rhodococcus rhodochrous]MCD2099432.1 hypothetical protein [Rhodococcus rhodochrous]MCD2123881.1 hypothetical protein [Rhodococcus rhodochrous]MCQ4136407.1 hypothetical protein [Rhodococcus rhodochrous]MDJ0020673.1 hypothetical protein [Rhodococcus rhodochrous]
MYAPFNVLFLLDQKIAQQRFFHNAAALMGGGGHVVVECFVPTQQTRLVDGPNPAFFPASKHVEVRSIGLDTVTLLVSENDSSSQVWQLNEVTLRHGQGVHIVPSTIAYLTCEQIDDLAAAAGFSRVSRTADWNGHAFTNQSRKHISTYALNKEI